MNIMYSPNASTGERTTTNPQCTPMAKLLKRHHQFGGSFTASQQ
jgi:hypothetical protein